MSGHDETGARRTADGCPVDWDLIDWWRDPRLAWGAGYWQGWHAAHEQIRNLLADEIGRMLYSTNCVPQRREADQHAAGASDWPGLDNMSPEQRQDAYVHILATWDRT